MDPKMIKYNSGNDNKFLPNSSDTNINESEEIKESPDNKSENELQYITE